MSMLTTPAGVVKSSSRGGARFDPDRRNPYDRINSESYRIVDNMRMQAGDLDDIGDYNSQEDQVRARLGAIMREQERLLVELGQGGRMALDLNRRAQRALLLVDALDAAQGLNEIAEAIESAQGLNRDTAEAGLAILQETEPRIAGVQPSRAA